MTAGPWRTLAVWTVGAVTLAVLWQGLSMAHIVSAEAVPSPMAIARDIWSNRADYAPNLGFTLLTATIGYALGNAAAILAAMLFSWRPRVERLARGFNLIAFAIPPITLGPLLAIAFQGAMPQVILAAVGVYFTTMTVTMVGLREVDPNALALVRLYGGGSVAELRWIRLRSALPAVMSGLRAGASAALLGAMMAEFGSGAPGLGSFLLASMSLGQPSRVWGVALVITTISLAIFGLLSWIAAQVSWRPVSTLGLGAEADEEPNAAPLRSWGGALTAILAAALPFAAWQALPWLLNVSPAVLQTPTALWSYLVASPDAGDAWSSIIAAARQTFPLALAGMLVGGGGALILALISDLYPPVGRIILLPVILLQSTPLVALTPLVVLLLGRGAVATLAITLSVCFFPAFVALVQALKSTPAAAMDILRLYGGSPMQRLRYVTLPYLTPYLYAAARLVAPKALLGVMTAEWIATGYGLGGLMNEARGNLDYGMIWSVAFLAVAIAVGAYQLILTIERIARRRSEGR